MQNTHDIRTVLEVYTGWCGPCVAMLSSLKKIKLEKGGDDLLLSIVRYLMNGFYGEGVNKYFSWIIGKSGHCGHV